MTQDQLKEQMIDYAKNNMNNKTILEVIKELLQPIENEMIEDGYISESNNLVTCELIIERILQND